MIIFAGAGGGRHYSATETLPRSVREQGQICRNPSLRRYTQGENKSDSGEPPAGLLEDSTQAICPVSCASLTIVLLTLHR